MAILNSYVTNYQRASIYLYIYIYTYICIYIFFSPFPLTIAMQISPIRIHPTLFSQGFLPWCRARNNTPWPCEEPTDYNTPWPCEEPTDWRHLPYTRPMFQIESSLLNFSEYPSTICQYFYMTSQSSWPIHIQLHPSPR